MRLPPRASTRSRNRSKSAAQGFGCKLEAERVVDLPHADRHVRFARPRGERGEPAQVHGQRDLRLVGRVGGDVDGGRHSSLHRGRPQQRGETSQLERRRVDALSEQGRFVERPPNVALHLVEQRVDGCGVGVCRSPGELQGGRQGDQVLVHAAVQLTLDRAAVGIGGQDETFSGCTLVLLGSHGRELTVIAMAESSGPAPLEAGGQPPPLWPAATVVGPAPAS